MHTCPVNIKQIYLASCCPATVSPALRCEVVGLEHQLQIKHNSQFPWHEIASTYNNSLGYFECKIHGNVMTMIKLVPNSSFNRILFEKKLGFVVIWQKQVYLPSLTRDDQQGSVPLMNKGQWLIYLVLLAVLIICAYIWINFNLAENGFFSSLT